MEHMKLKPLLARAAFAALAALCAACNVASPGEALPQADFSTARGNTAAAALTVPADPLITGIGASLERFAEIERAGGFYPGLGLAESELKESAGDYAGAAVAAYKELSWAYGYGVVSKAQVEEGLQNAFALFEAEAQGDSARSAGVRALKGCIAFARGNWKEAEELLSSVLSPDEEPDSFLRWMLMVCAFEQDNANDKGRAARSAYGAIRARYALFPEYWYRGMRYIGVTYAEPCINTSPNGPFAQDSRNFLAEHFGITPNGSDIRTQAEIENILRESVLSNNPKLLEELFPLMALPDNPYTLYALGAMQSLAAVPEFRAFFIGEASASPGRLGERLNFIARSGL